MKIRCLTRPNERSDKIVEAVSMDENRMSDKVESKSIALGMSFRLPGADVVAMASSLAGATTPSSLNGAIAPSPQMYLSLES